LDFANNPSAMREITKIQTGQAGLLRLFEEIRSYSGPIHLARTTCDLSSVWQQAWADTAGGAVSPPQPW
jgi:hypothetical protein